MRHEKLSALDPLVGEWVLDSTVGGRGRAVFEWIEDGAFLVQHVRAEPTGFESPADRDAHNPLPIVSVFGLDDRTGQFTMLYADSRGVFRHYSMELRPGVWSIWGQAGPEFHQRFAGSFSADGETISGAWDFSPDGFNWRRDFEVTYTKAG